MREYPDITTHYENYISFFPGDEARLVRLGQQIEDREDLCSRSNMTGHVTASGLVVDQEGRLCLIYHNFLQMYLQPGGHIDPTDQTIPGAALREVMEETGLSDVHLMQWCAEHAMPIDIDSHEISPRPERGEGAHVHHDFLYLFECFDSATTLRREEVSEVRWVSRYDLSTYSERFARIVEKIEMHGVIG